MRLLRSLIIVAVMGPVVAVATTLLPEFGYYWVPRPHTSSEVLSLLRTPRHDAVRSEVSQYELNGVPALSGAEILAMADAFARGAYRMPDGTQVDIAPTFRKADL